jgi:hypothetical protein
MKPPKTIRLPPGIDASIFDPPLDEPIDVPHPMAIALLYGNANEVFEEYNKIKIELLVERLSILSERLKIQRGNWLLLAVKLAEILVPGLRFKEGPGKRRGPPKSDALLELPNAVNEIVRAKKRCSVRQACRILSNRKGKWKGHKPSSLETRYYENRLHYKGSLDSNPILARMNLMFGNR